MAATSARVLPAGSACDPAACGTSGKEPIPCQAKHSSPLIAMPRGVRAPACERRQVCDFPRTPRTLSARRDCDGRTGQGYPPAGASLSTSAGTPRPCAGFYRRTSISLRGHFSWRTLQSNSTCCSGRSLSGSVFRIAGNSDQDQLSCPPGSTRPASCIGVSSIFVGRRERQMLRHSGHRISCIQPCPELYRLAVSEAT